MFFKANVAKVLIFCVGSLCFGSIVCAGTLTPVASGFIFPHALSSDGRYLTYRKIEGTTGWLDLQTGQSLSTGLSQSPAISADGRTVGNILCIKGVSMGLFDTDTQQLNCFRADNEKQTNNFSTLGTIPSLLTANGNLLVTDYRFDGRYDVDVAVYDRTINQYTNITADGNEQSSAGTLSDDGNFVVFSSAASNFVANDSNGVVDVFVQNLATKAITRVNVASDGSEANESSNLCVFINPKTNKYLRCAQADISSDGRFVVFSSIASNLVANDTNDKSDIFLHDRNTQKTTRISVVSDGSQADGISHSPVVSDDGRFIVFVSDSTNLDTNSSGEQAFLHDRQNGQTVRISPSSIKSIVYAIAIPGLRPSPAITADGRYIAFSSTNKEVYLYDRLGILADTDIEVTLKPESNLAQYKIPFNFILTVANKGSKVAKSVSANVTMSSLGNLTQFTSAAECSIQASAPSNVICDFGDLTKGQVVTRTLTASTSDVNADPMGFSYTTTASLHSLTSDSDITNNIAQTITTIPPEQHKLTVNKSGAGKGKITSTPNGIDCGATCSTLFNYNTTIYLTAVPDTDSLFAGWVSNGCPSDINTCDVSNFIQDMAVTANFELKPIGPILTVIQSGNGVVTSKPTGINCGTKCKKDYLKNTVVTLTAKAQADSTFKGWGGACSGMLSICRVTLSTAKDVVATFKKIPTYELTVTKMGTGSGIVSGTGIQCGEDCNEVYRQGTVVTLAAKPSKTAVFTGWTGVCAGKVAICTVNMTSAKNVKAMFTQR